MGVTQERKRGGCKAECYNERELARGRAGDAERDGETWKRSV